MKTRILMATLPLAVVLVAIAIFIYWAGSPVETPARWAAVYQYPDCEFKQDVSKTMKIMTFNIGYFSGMSNNLPVREDQYFFSMNMAAFHEYLAGNPVDIAAFQEIDFKSHRSYRIDQLDHIARKNGFPMTARVVNWDKRYVPFPYWPPSVNFGPMLSGQGLASRFEISSNHRVQLKDPDGMFFIKKMFYMKRLAQVSRVKVGEKDLIVVNVHLEAFNRETRRQQARQVLELCREFQSSQPLILLGDFNCVPPDAPKKTGFMDEPDTDYRGEDTIQLFLNEKWLESALTGQPTFPANQPDRQLDYIFYTPRWISRTSAYTVNLNSSDHLPVVMEFVLL